MPWTVFPASVCLSACVGLCAMSLDPVQGTVYNPVSSLMQATSWIAFRVCVLSLSAVCLKTVSAEQKPELALHFFMDTQKWDSALQNCTKLLWFSANCSCIGSGSNVPATPTSFCHPVRYMDYSPCRKLCSRFSCAVPPFLQNPEHNSAGLWIIVLTCHIGLLPSVHKSPSTFLLALQTIGVGWHCQRSYHA